MQVLCDILLLLFMLTSCNTLVSLYHCDFDINESNDCLFKRTKGAPALIQTTGLFPDETLAQSTFDDAFRRSYAFVKTPDVATFNHTYSTGVRTGENNMQCADFYYYITSTSNDAKINVFWDDGSKKESIVEVKASSNIEWQHCQTTFNSPLSQSYQISFQLTSIEGPANLYFGLDEINVFDGSCESSTDEQVRLKALNSDLSLMMALDSTDTSTEPTVAREESTGPTVAGTESTGPTVAGTESTEPTVAREESTGPTVAGTETTEPTVVREESTGPTVAGTETTEPTVAGTESTGPTVAGTESTEPTVVREESTEPTVAGIESTGPTVARTETTEPTVVREESTGPTAAGTETTEPTVAREESTGPIVAGTESTETITRPAVSETITAQITTAIVTSETNSATITGVGTATTAISATSTTVPINTGTETPATETSATSTTVPTTTGVETAATATGETNTLATTGTNTVVSTITTTVTSTTTAMPVLNPILACNFSGSSCYSADDGVVSTTNGSQFVNDIFLNSSAIPRGPLSGAISNLGSAYGNASCKVPYNISIVTNTNINFDMYYCYENKCSNEYNNVINCLSDNYALISFNSTDSPSKNISISNNGRSRIDSGASERCLRFHYFMTSDNTLYLNQTIEIYTQTDNDTSSVQRINTLTFDNVTSNRWQEGSVDFNSSNSNPSITFSFKVNASNTISVADNILYYFALDDIKLYDKNCPYVDAYNQQTTTATPATAAPTTTTTENPTATTTSSSETNLGLALGLPLGLGIPALLGAVGGFIYWRKKNGRKDTYLTKGTSFENPTTYSGYQSMEDDRETTYF